MYGAGPAKLAAIAGRPQNAGRKLKDDFYAKHPAILELIQDLEIAYKRNNGWIKGIDGRPLYVRRASTLLNTLLQNAATVVFKNWMVRLEQVRSSNSIYKDAVKQIIAYHDELQYAVGGSKKLAEDWGFCCCAAAATVGTQMGLKVPIAAEFKRGKNWRDCH